MGTTSVKGGCIKGRFKHKGCTSSHDVAFTSIPYHTPNAHSPPLPSHPLRHLVFWIFDNHSLSHSLISS